MFLGTQENYPLQPKTYLWLLLTKVTYSYDRTARYEPIPWQTLTPKERREQQKDRGQRLPASAMKELEELLQKNSAFKSFADLEREMIQHGYLPTIRNPRLRMLIETTGLPVFSH